VKQWYVEDGASTMVVKTDNSVRSGSLGVEGIISGT